MNKKEYSSEKEWIKNNIIYKPLSASGYLGKPRRYSLGNYTPVCERLFCDYVSDNSSNNELLNYLGINDDYTLEEFLNFDYRYNNFGFRDNVDYTIDNSENEIWCFGCSWTVGVGTSLERTWPELIKKETGLTVKNFGVSGCGPQTILRLLVNWLKFSKHKPKYILILGYFMHRMEIDSTNGEYHRIGLYRYIENDYVYLQKSDKIKVEKEKKKFLDDPAGYNVSYIDKINYVLEDFDSVTIDVGNYKMENYSIGRDVEFFTQQTAGLHEKTINDVKFKKKYYSLADELFSILLNNRKQIHTGFSKWWVSHLGPDLQQSIANDFLRNLTL